MGEVAYAGFWIRFAAKFVDGIIMNIVSKVFALLIGATFQGNTAGQRAIAMVYCPGAQRVLHHLFHRQVRRHPREDGLKNPSHPPGWFADDVWPRAPDG